MKLFMFRAISLRIMKQTFQFQGFLLKWLVKYEILESVTRVLSEKLDVIKSQFFQGGKL